MIRRAYLGWPILIILFLSTTQKLFAGDIVNDTVDLLWETQSEQDERVRKLKDEFNTHSKILSDLGIETTLKLDSIRMRLDSRSNSAVTPSCGNDECFNLYYFTGENFDKRNPARKTILYISGGPGQIQTFDKLALGRLEKTHNVVYFHLRGAGLSVVPPSHLYDKYLRAEHAIEDIEKLRARVLETTRGEKKPWDAIYGFSYGTVLAQRYARKYPENVRKLILHAPVFRNHDTDKAWSEQLRSNLKNIYSLIRSKEAAGCSCAAVDNQSMKIKVDGIVSPNDNLCFLEPTSDLKAIDRLVDKIIEVHGKLIDEYGTMGFIIDNFEKFKKIDSIEYPDEFYLALRKLQLLGVPQNAEASLIPGEIERLVDPAMVLGYYASLDSAARIEERNEGFSRCSITAPFFRNAPEETCKQTAYCDRLNQAKVRLRKIEPRSEPPRALYAFGISDGVQHWVPRVLRQDGIRIQNESCPKGVDLIKFAKSNHQHHTLLRDISRKIGIVPDDEYCIWDPKNFYHEVETLILTGGADLVTAGCQAEDFFDRGLAKSRRTLVEFPSWGHESDIPVEIVEKFLTASTQNNFRRAIRDELTKITGVDRTPREGTSFQCDVR